MCLLSPLIQTLFYTPLHVTGQPLLFLHLSPEFSEMTDITARCSQSTFPSLSAASHGDCRSTVFCHCNATWKIKTALRVFTQIHPRAFLFVWLCQAALIYPRDRLRYCVLIHVTVWDQREAITSFSFCLKGHLFCWQTNYVHSAGCYSMSPCSRKAFVWKVTD